MNFYFIYRLISLIYENKGKMNYQEVSPEWYKLTKEMEQYTGRFLAIILGEGDTGKTSMARFLVSHFQDQGKRIAWIDTDLGQSTLGPPTTVGMLIPALKNKENFFNFRFVGSISPVGHLLQTVVSVRRLVDIAVNMEVEGIILDTSGFIGGRVGFEFKFQKIDVMNPTHLIALERGRELEGLLKIFSGRKMLHLYRFPVPDFIQSKTREQRIAYRKERFQKYFSKARQIDFSFRGIRLLGHLPSFYHPEQWQDLLIGFADEMNNTLALGLIQEADLKQKALLCFTPLQKKEKVRSIRFGSLYLKKNGQELSLRRY